MKVTTLFSKTRLLRYGLLMFVTGLSLIGCGSLNYLGIVLSNPTNNTIGELQPSSSDLTVNLQGKVINIAPFLGNGAYQLQDKTGNIWVLTEQSLPQLGAEIAIEGQVKYQQLNLGQQEMGELYILELKSGMRESQAQTPVQPATQQQPLPPSSVPEKPPAPVQPPLEQDDLFLPHK